jgi:hypothetical protein
MNLIKGEVGVARFMDNQKALYPGLEAQHISNAGLNGNEGGNPTNFSINAPAGMLVGFSCSEEATTVSVASAEADSADSQSNSRS